MKIIKKKLGLVILAVLSSYSLIMLLAFLFMGHKSSQFSMLPIPRNVLASYFTGEQEEVPPPPPPSRNPNDPRP